MKTIIYDIFISYRRQGGSTKAQLVKSEIKQRGVKDERIFLDTHSLHDGDFEQKIKNAIEQSQSVIVIISKGCFDKVKGTDYWYMEIKEALRQEKKVVPIFFDGITSFSDLNVPIELLELTRKNAISYQHEYADATFDKLLTFIGQDNHTAEVQETSHGNYAFFSSNQEQRNGCLFSFKYKSCLLTITLVALVCFVLVAIAIFVSKTQENDKMLIAKVDPQSTPKTRDVITSKPTEVIDCSSLSGNEKGQLENSSISKRYYGASENKEFIQKSRKGEKLNDDEQKRIEMRMTEECSANEDYENEILERRRLEQEEAILRKQRDQKESRKPTASPPPASTASSPPASTNSINALLGMWYCSKDSILYQYGFYNHGVILKKYGKNIKAENLYGKYFVSGDSIHFKWHKKEESAKYTIKNNIIVLSFAEGHSIILRR